MMSRFKLTKLEFGYLSAGSATIYICLTKFRVLDLFIYGWFSCGYYDIFDVTLACDDEQVQAHEFGFWVFVSWFSSLCISAGSAGILGCYLTVGRLLCQALLVKVFVKIVDSRRLESEKVTNSLGLLGQNLLVYFEG